MLGLLLLFAAAAEGAGGVVPGLAGLLALLPAAHWLATRKRRQAEEAKWKNFAENEIQVWPFRRPGDLEEARRHPFFFTGRVD